MANELTPTLLEKYVQVGTTMFNEFEQRKPKSGAVDVFKEGRNTGLVDVAGIEAAKTSLRRPTEVAVTKQFTPNVYGVRAISPTADIMSTARVALSWITLAFSVKVVPSMHADNDISYARYVTDLLFQALKGVYHTATTDGVNKQNSLEKQMLAYIAAQKYTTPPDSSVPGVIVENGAYKTTSKDFEINALPVMEELLLSGPYDSITHVSSLAASRRQATLGANNSENFAQYGSDYDYRRSNYLAITSGAEQTHYMMPKGTLAVLNIVEDDAKAGRSSSDGTYSVFTDPYHGFRWGVYDKTSRADMSAEATGWERTVVQQYDFAADFAFVRPYSSVAGVTPIIKFDTFSSLV